MKNLSPFLFITMLLLSACGYKIAVDMPWNNVQSGASAVVSFQKDNFQSVLDSASSNNLPVFIDFYTAWCGPCKVMDRDVFTNAKVATYLNEGFINLKIDAEKGGGKLLAKKFVIKAYPTLVFINKKGAETDRHEGLMTASELLKAAKRTVK